MKARIAALLALSLSLTECVGIPYPPASQRTRTAAAAIAGRIASIAASWEAAGGSRELRPPAGWAKTSAKAPVSSAWWGFDPVDSTSALQAAVDSGAPTVVVPFMREPWILSRTLDLRGGRIEILLEPGVVLLAKQGAFRDRGECLIEAVGAVDFSILGYGATFRMRKEDYMQSPYQKAQWRHAVSLRGVARARIAGLRIESAGGDGIYVGVQQHGNIHEPCEDLLLQDLEVLDSNRQGISVISARRLLIEDSLIKGSSGALPMSGIDFEPNGGDPGFEDCVIRSCRIAGNKGVGILYALSKLDAGDAPVSIRVQDCVIDNLPIAVWLRGLNNGVRGTLTFSGSSFRGLKFLRSSSDFSIVLERTL